MLATLGREEVRSGWVGKKGGSGDVLKRLDVLACHNIPQLQTGREHVSADAYSRREKECVRRRIDFHIKVNQ